MLSWAFDRNVIDGTVNGVAAFYAWAATRLRRIQTGFVANYAMSISLGIMALLVLVAAPLRETVALDLRLRHCRGTPVAVAWQHEHEVACGQRYSHQ